MTETKSKEITERAFKIFLILLQDPENKFIETSSIIHESLKMSLQFEIEKELFFHDCCEMKISKSRLSEFVEKV